MKLTLFHVTNVFILEIMSLDWIGLIQNAKQVVAVNPYGRHGIDMLLGSMADGVIRWAPCDIFAARIDLEG